MLKDAKNIDYVTGDLFPEKYPKGTVKVDLLKIPFEPESFDIVICNHVLEHIPEDESAMKELQRVLKKSGWGILMVPIDWSRKTTYEDPSITTPEARADHFGQVDHVRWYGQDYTERLKKAGFKVDIIDYFNTFSEFQQKQWSLSDEKIFKVYK